jgi:hypothetical protein
LLSRGGTFVALANEGDVQAGLHQRSSVYELLVVEREEL